MVELSETRTLRVAVVVLIVVSLACFLVGMIRASSAAWVSDDAFISFRYAENLAEGKGLVFNPGERVEGYTNFLWTMWCALAIRLGANPVPWSLVWGVVFYCGSIALLVVYHLRLRREAAITAVSVPIGAMVAALHGEWSVFAVGGLETSLFTFLALWGFLLLTKHTEPNLPHFFGAGVVFGAAALTRPDGVIFAAVAAVWVIAVERSSLASAARASVVLVFGFLVLWLPFMMWRIGYYGEVFPNTYYAKSAYLSWFSQGVPYVLLFFSKYWVLLTAIPVLIVVNGLWRDGRSDERGYDWWKRQVVLALAFIGAYTFFVAKVGGDFMFGRFLVPTVPFWAVLLDLGLIGFVGRPLVYFGMTAVVGFGLLVSPTPDADAMARFGVVDEARHYSPSLVDQVERRAEVMKRYFEGLHVSVGFTGSEARLIYLSGVTHAIECETGLNDLEIARQDLPERGRPGHEKHAGLDYLVERHRVNFVLNPYAWWIVGAEGRIPALPVELDGIQILPLFWDPEVMRELEQRGARFRDCTVMIDEVISNLDQMDPRLVAGVYAGLKRFYFDHVNDPEREAAFKQCLHP